MCWLLTGRDLSYYYKVDYMMVSALFSRPRPQPATGWNQDKLHHARPAATLTRLLPRGFSSPDHILYDWFWRALRYGFPPRTARQEAKARRAAIQIWCAMRTALRNNVQTGNVTENKPLRKDTKPRIWFRLQSGRPHDLLTCRAFEKGRKPRRRAKAHLLGGPFRTGREASPGSKSVGNLSRKAGRDVKLGRR